VVRQKHKTVLQMHAILLKIKLFCRSLLLFSRCTQYCYKYRGSAEAYYCSLDARVSQDVLHVPGVQAAAGQHDLLRLSRRRDILQVMLRQELRAPRVGVHCT
jgi:hypothetical protein